VANPDFNAISESVMAVPTINNMRKFVFPWHKQIVAAARGGYGLGTGNSVPEYVPRENYFAMLSAATDLRR